MFSVTDGGPLLQPTFLGPPPQSLPGAGFFGQPPPAFAPPPHLTAPPPSFGAALGPPSSAIIGPPVSAQPATQAPPLPPIGQPPPAGAVGGGNGNGGGQGQRPSSLAPGGPVAGGMGALGGGPLDTTGMPGMFLAPRRPNHGTEGRPILLRANHFQVRIPGGVIQHYEVNIVPDKCPRRVNR